jgi:hypothetical protein
MIVRQFLDELGVNSEAKYPGAEQYQRTTMEHRRPLLRLWRGIPFALHRLGVFRAQRMASSSSPAAAATVHKAPFVTRQLPTVSFDDGLRPTISWRKRHEGEYLVRLFKQAAFSRRAQEGEVDCIPIRFIGSGGAVAQHIIFGKPRLRQHT